MHTFIYSIGGVIGTGLFLGTANSLQVGGPIGLLLAYLAVGTICYSVMVHSFPSFGFNTRQRLTSGGLQVSLGELVTYLPVPGGHIKLAERFVNGAFSFAMGWNYWYNWTIVLPAELSAASVLVNFWDKNTNFNSLWIIICLLVVVFINFLGAGMTHYLFVLTQLLNIVGDIGAYGEAEFWFASIKVLTIVGSSHIVLAHI
jgi:amino acid transporter